MKKRIANYFKILSLICMIPLTVSANSGGHLEDANIDPYDQKSLQRGAKTFVNRCQGCHSLQYQRYNRLAKDLGLTKEEVLQNLILDGSKIHAHMNSAMTVEKGEQFFGKAPPDLTLTARSRGVDWIYTYLKSFYIDETRPFGVNNTVLPGASMPHVLAGLQGLQEAEYTKKAGSEEAHFHGFKMVQSGSLSAEEYDNTVRDLVNFLDYVAEPIKLERRRLGVYVLIFLAFFFMLTYLLKKEYWKDIH